MISDAMQDVIRRAFASSINAKERFVVEHGETLERVARLIADSLLQGHKLLLFGNGGSAADAQHIVAEFVNRFLIDRPLLLAIALTTDISALTSIANDDDYKEVFAKQVRALAKEGDIALAISTSGNSANVLVAIDVCKQLKITTIGLTGGNGGKMAGKVDFLLKVSEGRNSPRIQETHILVGHVICDIVDQKLFPAK